MCKPGLYWFIKLGFWSGLVTVFSYRNTTTCIRGRSLRSLGSRVWFKGRWEAASVTPQPPKGLGVGRQEALCSTWLKQTRSGRREGETREPEPLSEEEEEEEVVVWVCVLGWPVALMYSGPVCFWVADMVIWNKSSARHSSALGDCCLERQTPSLMSEHRFFFGSGKSLLSFTSHCSWWLALKGLCCLGSFLLTVPGKVWNRLRCRSFVLTRNCTQKPISI